MVRSQSFQLNPRVPVNPGVTPLITSSTRVTEGQCSTAFFTVFYNKTKKS